MQKITELAPQLWPLLAPRVNRAIQDAINSSLNSGSSSLGTPATPAGSMQIHDLSSTWHTGTLADSQAPQFLMLNGTRALTGNMAVNAGVTIDGVDLSAHAANPDAHHATASAFPPIYLVGQQIFIDYTNGLETVANKLQVKLATDSGLNIVSTALAMGTPTIAGVASANTVTTTTHSHAIDWSANPGAASKILGSDASGYLNLVRLVLTDRLRTPLIDTVSAGLSIQANSTVTLQPTTDVLLQPGSNLVKLQSGVNFQSYNYASQITGMRVTQDGQADFRYLFVDEMHAKSFIADLEQALAGGQIICKSVAMLATTFLAPAAVTAVPTYRTVSASGLNYFSLDVSLPGGTAQYDLMVATISYPKARTITSAPAGWTLITTRAGTTTLNSLSVYYKIASASEPSTFNWTFDSFGDLYGAIASYSNVNLNFTVDVFASQSMTSSSSVVAPTITTTAAGDLVLFVANHSGTSTTATVPAGFTERLDVYATNNWLYLADRVFGGTGATGTATATLSGSRPYNAMQISFRPLNPVASLTVRDLPSATGMAAFQSGDTILVRTFSRAGGSLSITNCWGVVTSYVDNGDKTQTWLFTRSASPNAGAMAANTAVLPDAIILDFGVSGNGYYEVNAIDGMYGANSPYAQVVVWTGHPATGQVVRTRMGNLYGIFSITGEYGLYAGAGTADTNSYIRISNNTVKLNNIPLTMWNGATQTMNLNAAGTDFWIGLGSGDKRLAWDGATLTVKGAITVQAGSNVAAGATVGATWGTDLNSIPSRFGNSPGAAGLYLTASNLGYWDGGNWKVWIDSTGKFYFGGSSGASLRWDGSVLSGYDSGNNQQWYAGSTDGVIRFGGVNGWLGAAGLKLKAVTIEPGNSANSITWNETLPSTQPTGEIYSWVTSWNELVAVARNLSTTRGARSRIGNSIDGTFSAGMRATSAYSGGWGHSIEFYGNAYFNNSVTAWSSLYAAGSISTDGNVSAGGYLAATTSLNGATLALSSSGVAMGAFSQGSNGTGYGYFDYNYAGTRMGYILWRPNDFNINADGRYLSLTGTRVGVKTISPAYDFDVSGEARITGSIRSDVALSLAPQGSAPGASAVYFVLFVDSADNKLKYRITSGLGSTVRTITYT